MSAFHPMLQKVSSSPHYDSMQRTARLLDDHFGINYFWFYRISKNGDYCFLGTHTKWIEYAIDNSLLQHFPCVRHPDVLQSGISLMKNCEEANYKNVLDEAWKKFCINFSINLIEKSSIGVEAFGFATRHKDARADEGLLNELPLLRQFCHYFKKKHRKLFDLLDDNTVNIASLFGPAFSSAPKKMPHSLIKEQFLSGIGMPWINFLTSREEDVLKLISKGFPASYIALQLGISPRTVEKYIVNLKGKLDCSCKAELIQKACDFVSVHS